MNVLALGFWLLLAEIHALSSQERNDYYRVQYFHDGSKPLSSWNWPHSPLITDQIDCTKTPMECELAGFDPISEPELRLISNDYEEEFVRITGSSFLDQFLEALMGRDLFQITDFMTSDLWEIYHLQNVEQFNLVLA